MPRLSGGKKAQTRRRPSLQARTLYSWRTYSRRRSKDASRSCSASSRTRRNCTKSSTKQAKHKLNFCIEKQNLKVNLEEKKKITCPGVNGTVRVLTRGWIGSGTSL